jgi:hypothetical protein
MVPITRQRVGKAVQALLNMTGLGFIFALAVFASVIIMMRAWLVWLDDVQTRQDPVSAVMLISTMVAVLVFIGVGIRLRRTRDDS